MVKAKKAKLHINIPPEWKRWLKQTVKRDKSKQETVVIQAFQLLSDSLEENSSPKIPIRAA